MIQERLQAATQAKIRDYPCNNIRASEIGHPCQRFIVLSITNWQDKKPIDATLQCIFDLGNALEAEVIRRIKEAGFEVLTAKKNFKIEKPLITGREDILLQDPESGELYPCEIKGLAPQSFDKINTIEDMLHHKAYYIRKYPAQLYIYEYKFSKETGFFVLFNKLTGRIKIIEAPLDYNYVDKLFQKSNRIYEHIAAKTLPDTIDDETICSDCPLLHICGAKIDRGSATIDTGELEELLLRREELMPKVRELDEIKKAIKSNMRSCNRAFTASFMVEKRVIAKRPFVVAGSVYTKEIIKRIGVRQNETNQNIQ